MRDVRVYEFGAFRLDATERLLLREGQPVALTTKLFDLLLLLVQNSGRLLSKDYLMEQVWQDSHVEISNLTVSISVLRKALDEGQKRFRYIETVSGHGYRFTAGVRELSVREQAKESAAGDSSQFKTIAVLPFQTSGGGMDDEYFGLGMADTLIAKLSSINQLIVTPLGTVLKRSKPEEEPIATGRRLGADAVLYGRIKKIGDEIRVTSQLQAVSDEKLLWAGNFDQKFESLFSVQDSIAQQTVHALVLKLEDRERELLVKRHTANSEAFQAYQKGRYFWNKRSEKSLEKGLEYFQQAIEVDRNYALAYVGVADCYNLLANYGVLPPAEFIPRAKSLVQKALDLDNTLAEAYTTLGYIKLFHDWEWPGAEREFRRAVELNPNYAIAHHWYAMCLMVTGRFDEALKEMRLAQSLDPLSPIINGSLAGYYFYARRYAQAVEQCRETLEIDPNFYLASGIQGTAYAQMGMYEEAARKLESAAELSKDPEVSAELGYVYALRGEEDKARKLLQELKDLSKQTYVTPFGIAIVHVGLGEFREALEWLDRAYHDRNHWLVWLKVEPRLDPLRRDPRFVDLIRRVGLETSTNGHGEVGHSLAVLPIVNASGDTSLEYLSDGFGWSIINKLSQLSLLKVMAYGTVLSYKGKSLDPFKIRRELGVSALMMGKLFKSGDELTIRVELIDTLDGSRLWGKQYACDSSDISAIQGEIAGEVSKKLRVGLTDTERLGLAKRYTENTEAYQLYLKGRHFYDRYTFECVSKAIECFQQAIALDPNYALAYAGLSDSYCRLSNTYLPPGEAMPKAMAMAARAIELDDNLADGHMALGMVKLYFDRDWSGAENEFKRAVELSPGAALAHHRYGWFLVLMKRFEEGLSEIMLAYSLNPLAFRTTLVLATCYNFVGQYDQAVKHYLRVLELDADHYPAHMGLGWTYLRLWNFEEAFKELREAFRLGRDYLSLGLMGYAYALTGKRRQGRKLLAELIKASEREYVSPYNMAAICAGLGDREKAFQWLEKLYEEGNEWLTWLNISPELDSLRSDPRFADLLQRVGFTPS